MFKNNGFTLVLCTSYIFVMKIFKGLKKMFENNGFTLVLCTSYIFVMKIFEGFDPGHTTPWGQNFYTNVNLVSL